MTEGRTFAGTTLAQPSVLRSAVNAPQFVPKSTPPPPSLASLSLVCAKVLLSKNGGRYRHD